MGHTGLGPGVFQVCQQEAVQTKEDPNTRGSQYLWPF